jgi:hypothetical protein
MTRPSLHLHVTVCVIYAVIVMALLQVAEAYFGAIPLWLHLIVSLLLGMQGSRMWIAYWRRK